MLFKNILFYFLSKCPSSIGILTALLHSIYSNPFNIIRLLFYKPFTKQITTNNSSSTTTTTTINNNNNDKGIYELKTITINNTSFCLLIRGKSINNPIILCLHGGPGISEIPYYSIYSNYLEDNYTLVFYDQRCTCKSGYINLNKNYKNKQNEFLNTLNINEHVNDTILITEWLINYFNNTKNGIYLIGGSWGTILALYAVKQRPDLYLKVLLRGVVTNGPKSELLSWEYIIDRMKYFNYSNNEINSMIKYKPPFYNNISNLLKQREYLSSLGGSDYESFQSTQPIPLWYLTHQMMYALFNTNEISLSEILQAKECLMLSLKYMWPQVEQINMLDIISTPTNILNSSVLDNTNNQVEDIKRPLIFVHGKHDYCTVHSLVEEFITNIKAKEKYLIWFLHSGHSPHKEESEEFANVVKYFFTNEEDKSNKSYNGIYPIIKIE